MYLPDTLTSILGAFSSCFTAPSHLNFARVITGWMLCRGRHTVSRVVQAAETAAPRVHHSRLYRFFSRARWVPDELARELLDLLLPWLGDVVECAVDDTLCRKGGPQIFGAAIHRDGSASGGGRDGVCFAFGHAWVVLSIHVPLPFSSGRGVAVPVLARLYRGKRHCPPEAYRKRTELAAELVELLASWLPEGRSLSVAGDSEYACRTVVRELPEGVVFVGPMCRDAALHEPPPPYPGRGRPAKKGARLPSPTELAEDREVEWSPVRVKLYGRRVELLVKTIVCLWPTVAGERLVRVVLTRDPAGRMQDRSYFSTDASLGAVEILERVARRWELEVTFRDAKQLLGLADPQNGWWRRPHGERRDERRPGAETRGDRGRRAVERTAPLALLVHGLVVVWYLEHGRPERDVAVVRQRSPWRRDKHHVCFADMLAAVREEIWRERLSAYPLPERVRRNLTSLLAPTWRGAA